MWIVRLALRRPYCPLGAAHRFEKRQCFHAIHEGIPAKILLQEFPGQEFDGMVTRTAGALDPQSRTMQIEVQVPNHDGKLYAGMYGQVKFLLVD
jgi:multidrug efflux pump subunit AcrA (membrane-fusion protein)